MLEPLPGAVVNVARITVRGLAQPGATITRDIPFWFDEHTTADAAGRWTFEVELSPGDNAFTFRVGDDRNTAVRIIVRYEPRP